MTARILVVVVALVVSACSGPAKPPIPPLPPNVPPPTAADCDKAQETLERLGCRRDDGTPWSKTRGGADFAAACKHALEDGRNWNPPCIAKIPDCDTLMPAYRGGWCGE